MERPTEMRGSVLYYSDTGKPVNFVWDACVEVLGYEPKTVSELKLWGKMVTSLQKADATPEKIRSVAQFYRRNWPHVDFTITALEKWYSHFLRLKEQRSTRIVCPECQLGGGHHASDCSKATKREALTPLTLSDPLMERGVALVRSGADHKTNDQLRAEIRDTYQATAGITELDIDELLRYAAVVRATASFGAKRS